MKNTWLRRLAFLSFTLTLVRADANILGNMQTLSPTPDSLFFQNVHSSKTLGHNYFNVGLFSAYVVNELSVYDDLVTPEFVNYKDSSITYDIIFAWGLGDTFELMYSQPGFIDQKPDSNQSKLHRITKGVNVHRPGIKWDISNDSTGGFAVAGSVDFPMTQNDPYVGVNPKPIYNLEAIYDIRGTTSAWGFNLGYRKRTPGGTPEDSYFFPLRDQLIYSIAYVWGLQKRYRLHAEIYGASALDKNPHPEAKHVTALEGLLGMKYRFRKNFWGHLGATAELSPEGLAPAARVYAGLNYFFGLGNERSSDSQQRGQPLDEGEVFSASPSSLRMPLNSSERVFVGGGRLPYRFQLSRNFGSFDQTLMLYSAPAEPGQVDLIITDAKGAVQRIPIEVYQNLPPTPAETTRVLPLAALPSQLEVFEGGSGRISTSGGAAPFTYRLSRPFGRFDESTMTYLAPTTPGDVDLIITDSQNTEISVPIRVIAPPKPSEDFVIKNLEFEFNTSDLTTRSRAFLNQNISKIRSLNVERIIVSGHTDSIGTWDYNQQLSLSRAQTVADILKSELNLSNEQVQAVGYGPDKPIASNNTDSGRQTNRRVELKLYYKTSQ